MFDHVPLLEEPILMNAINGNAVPPLYPQQSVGFA
jgi:hypothetical protein